MDTQTLKWLKKELDGIPNTAISYDGKRSIIDICRKYNYNQQQCKEVIADGLWYNGEDFWRLHHKKFY